MYINKRALIFTLIAGILVTLGVTLYILSPTIFMSDEERALNDFMGAYVASGPMILVDGALGTRPDEDATSRDRYYITKDTFCMLIKSGVDHPRGYGQINIIDPVEYTCEKITNDYLGNGLLAQGQALRGMFGSDAQFHEKVKGDAYAFTINAPAGADPYYIYPHPSVFFYINGEYYQSGVVYAEKLQKLR